MVRGLPVWFGVASPTALMCLSCKPKVKVARVVFGIRPSRPCAMQIGDLELMLMEPLLGACPVV